MDVSKSNGNPTKKENELLPKCGIIMPISGTELYSAEHWTDVLVIIKDVILNAGFEPNLVSYADDIGIIQKRIIQNLYNNEIIVCDVSSKNPNVMFELGIRLAFDKPTIIIKDDHTDYTFDTSIIEHITYPRDLRFNKIVSFKENLNKKITGTFEKSKKDPKYSTFLKSFGEYKVAHLEEKQISSDKYILKALEEIRNEITQIKRQSSTKDLNRSPISSLNIIRENMRHLEIEKQVGDLISTYLEKGSLKSFEVLKNPRLVSSLVDFVYDNLPSQKSVTKEEIAREVESSLLPF